MDVLAIMVLGVLAYLDLKSHSISLLILLCVVMGALAYGIGVRQADGWELFSIGLLCAALFSVGRLTQDGFGQGDCMVCAALCLVWGLKKGLLIIWCSVIMCGLAGVILIVCKRATYKTKLPLVPFVLAGQLIKMIIV